MDEAILQRLADVERLAIEMAGEIEWAGIFGARGPEADEVERTLAKVLRFEPFQAALVQNLKLTFELLRESPGVLAGYVGHQELELEAAGICQSVLKKTLGVAGGDATRQMLRSLALTCKFKRLPLPVTQAPPDVRVPSMRQQLGG